MKAFKNEAYNDISTIRSLSASPDGRFVLYPVQTMDTAKDVYMNDLWVYDSLNDREYRLTSGGKAGFYFWKDETTVAFSSNRGDGNPGIETVYYTISVFGGEAEVWLKVPRCGAQISPLKDGTFLVRADIDANAPGKGEEANWLHIDEYPYFMDGGIYVNKSRRALFLFNPSDGSMKQLTLDTMNVLIPYFSTDVIETDEAFYFPEYTYTKDAAGMACICSYDRKTGELKELCLDSCYVFSLWKSEDRIYYGSWAIEDGPYIATIRIRSVSVSGGDLRTDAEPDWELGSVRQQGSSTYIVCNDCAHGYLALWKDGREERIDTGCVHPSAIAPCRDVIYFIGQKKDRLGEVYSLRDGKVKQLSHRNDRLFEEYSFSANELLVIESCGHRIEGWVMKPANYEPGRKYPAILNIHGGPHGCYSDQFVMEHQRWTNEGYFVLFCNPVGSTTYGRDFQDVSGKLGAEDYTNIMDFTDAAIAAYPDIDSSKIAVTGQSYGGYMSNWVIGHTSRFAAAAPRMSISNWFSMHGTSVERWYGDRVIASTPWENPELAWEQSPLKYAKQVVTPTLFIQHEKDQYTPLEQAQQMFIALLENGVDTEMYVNKGCGHGGRKISHLLHDIDIMIEWFDRYLKNK